MSKAIGKALKILAVVALVIVVAVVLVVGMPLAVAISTFATIGKAALAAYAVGSALDPPGISTGNFKQEQAGNLVLTSDPSPPRWHILGEAATGGTLVYREAFGAKEDDIYFVIALAGHECDSLTKFEYNGTEITFSSNNAVGDFEDKMFLYFHDGSESQAADATLVAASSKWTVNHRLRGVTYVVLRVVTDTQLYEGGLQEMRFTLKGAKAYDPRLDSTRTEVSGSGSHRVDDQSTWEWTDNTALLTARYAYGYRLNNVLVYGKGFDDDRIDWVDVVQSANDNEGQVALKAGGTQDRYTCNGVQIPTQTHARNISAIVSSMAGMFYQTGSKWHMQSGVPHVSTKSRGTDDFIGPVKSRGQRDPLNKYNAVKGLFPDASQRYEATDFPPLKLTTELAADGNQEHWLLLNLPFTDNSPMAQRIRKLALMRTRMNRDLVAPLNGLGLQDAVADTVTVTHIPLNINAMKMRLIKWEFRIVNTEGGIGFAVQETLEEEDDDLIYSWDETTDEQTPTGGDSITPTTKQPLPGDFIEDNLTFPGGAVYDGDLNADVAGEPGGIVSDPSFVFTTAKGFGTLWTRSDDTDITIDLTGGEQSDPCLRMVGDAGANRLCFTTRLLPVKAGDKLWVRARVWVDNAFIYTGIAFRCETIERDADENPIAFPAFFNTNDVTKGSWETVEGTVIISNAATDSAQVLFLIEAGKTAGFILVDNVNAWLLPPDVDNLNQDWPDITGVGIPDDNADVTGDNIAADTVLVDSTAAATVKGGAVRANSAITAGIKIDTDVVINDSVTDNAITDLAIDNDVTGATNTLLDPANTSWAPTGIAQTVDLPDVALNEPIQLWFTTNIKALHVQSSHVTSVTMILRRSNEGGAFISIYSGTGPKYEGNQSFTDILTASFIDVAPAGANKYRLDLTFLNSGGSNTYTVGWSNASLTAQVVKK